MKSNPLLLGLCFSLPCLLASAKDYLISTNQTSLLIKADQGQMSSIQYYGSRIDAKDISSVYDAGQAFWSNSYPAFGLHSWGEKAIEVVLPDGNMSLDLVVDQVKEYTSSDARITEVILKDKVYPFVVKQFYKAYKGTDVISTWVEIVNNGDKPVVLNQFASAYIPVRRGDNWLTHFHGNWGDECIMEEEKLTNGQKVISNKSAPRNAHSDNPSIMVSLDGQPREEVGHVIGGTLAWAGNYDIRLDATNNDLNIIAGINEDSSRYILDPGRSLTTPEWAMTYSESGKGGVSRAFHRWARSYKLNRGHVTRDILLNSWEGVYFKVNQAGMEQMMKDIAAMGGELFVMDDGWFGNKYPRNDGSSSLGDWVVCKEKLPKGLDGLIQSAQANKIKFGIWIEPEMANTKSELFERHPEWVLSQSNRPLSTGRGGTQVILDLTNPAVQDFVFGVVDNLMTTCPQIAYIKWDANCGIMNYGSHYLPADKQSHIYIEYHKGLQKVLERIRAKYPNLVIQACASGGGRVNYGLLPYFDEFWTSDNTDALQRVYMQWGTSHFYPAIAMGSHVSANKNHQTGRVVPLKFRFDVAMSGRLGMEIQPKDMSAEDKIFATQAIAAYKKVRPIVQFGDLYRLISPHDNLGLASLMYATPELNRAVLFAYKTSHFVNQNIPVVRLTGVDPDKYYKIEDLTPVKADRKCSLHGKIISGKVLKETGLKLPLKGEYSSLALELTAQP